MRILTRILLALVLSLSLPMALAAKSKARAEEGGSSGMAGRLGIGGAIVPTTQGDLPGISADFWIGEKLALEGILIVGSSSIASGGSNGSGGPANDSNSSFGLGVAGRFVLASANDVNFGLGARLAVVNVNNTHPLLGTGYVTNTLTYNLFVGANVEAFVPMWRSISVEASTGLNVMMDSSVYPGSLTGSQSNFFLGGTNAWPVNVAFHYYF